MNLTPYQYERLRELGLTPIWCSRTRQTSPETPSMPNVQPDTWEHLQHQIAHCQACSLASSRTHTVFGRGSHPASWLLVGEAPGQHEDEQGLPFVGAAGQLLEAMLYAVGLNATQDYFIANVIKCRPPRNRTPHPDEIAHCRPYLDAQIQALKPHIIVALGRVAAQALLNTEQSLKQLRGRVHDYAGIPLIVTYHPAYLLRSLPDKAHAWRDWLFARNVFEQQRPTAT